MLIIIKDNETFVIRHEDEPENHTFKIDMQGTIYGYKGRPVVRLPKGFKKTDFVFNNIDGIENQYKNLLIQLINGENAKYILFYERLINAGLKNFDSRSQHYYYNIIDIKTFSQWLKLAREFEKEYPQKTYTLKTLIDYEEHKKFLQAKNMQDIITYYGENFARYIYDNFKDNWNKVSKWLSDDNFYKAVKAFNCPDYKIIDMFKDMFNWSELLNIKLSNHNPIDQYLKLQRQYELHENEIINLTLKKHQNQEWTIEDDDFIVIVPTTIDELIYEGKHNHNCVGDYWTRAYGNNLKKGRQNRGVVFIREKANPNKSYITCDFNLDDFRICQYLATCNEYVTNKKAIEFESKLQRHLFMFK